MKAVKPTLLGYTLLGLLHQKPASGYDLRKLFAATPLMSYSSSPGAIYPALGSLESQGLIRSTVEEQGLRRRNVFRPTSAGTKCLRTWLLQPLTTEDVVRKIDSVMMRFGLMDQVAGREASLNLLRGFEPLLAIHVAGLQRFLDDNGSAMNLSGRLALESGVRSYKGLLSWSRDAIAEYERAGKRGKK